MSIPVLVLHAAWDLAAFVIVATLLILFAREIWRMGL